MSIVFPEPLSAKEEKYYIEKFQWGDESARDILIERNLRLVAHIAKKYSGSSIPSDDLISIGTIGLIKAVDTFRSHRSARLSTYASRCIENEILMSLRASRKLKNETSLSAPLGTDKDGNEIIINDTLGTDPGAVEDHIGLKFQIEKMEEAIDACLSPREKAIIINRYGLYGSCPMTQMALAQRLNISRSYVSRIEKKALEKLRAFMKV